ncbi:MAG TPA: glycosyltransferase [Terriglobales bacterium]|nr:glycosyltransferase [Terriglobales bacterium]
MRQRLKFRMFAHSWVSDWNHGNAHFLRGLAHELVKLGHEVRCYEQEDSWSRSNLEQEGAEIAKRATQQFYDSFPELRVEFYRNDDNFERFATEQLRGTDIVIIHEWNPPQVVNKLLSLKQKLGLRALLHDTHHRAYTSPREILELNLGLFDGVLAFGRAIQRIYQEGFGIPRAWTFHEAADMAHFHAFQAQKNTDVIWVGNWGDEERTRELDEFLIQPVANLGAKVGVHGVRYPKAAREALAQAGIQYRGYLSNLQVPQAYAQSALTLHVPRRFYANGLSGVPTIRVFEALACGIPLLCAPWTDTEGLFREGKDYICLSHGQAMEAEIRYLLRDEKARSQMAAQGLETIRQRHTCAHRAQQLLEICEELGR